MVVLAWWWGIWGKFCRQMDVAIFLGTATPRPEVRGTLQRAAAAAASRCGEFLSVRVQWVLILRFSSP